ncbi:MAG: hypothetical protein AB7N24_19010 [Dehalococcoidia bacterium]
MLRTTLNIGSFISVIFLATAIGLSSPGAASASGGSIVVITGMTTSEVTLTYHPDSCGTSYWHCDEGNHPSNTGLDMTNALGSTGNAAVWFQSYTYSGYAFAVITPHQYGSSYCPGADVAIWIPYPNDESGTWVGYVDFVQVNVSQTFGTGFYVGSGWTFHTIGTVVNGVGSGNCSSTGSHLHQSGTQSGTNMWTNWPVDSDDDSGKPGIQIQSTGSYGDNWLHWITY